MKISNKNDSENEAVETTDKESEDYSHIDSFVKELDPDELIYLKECLSKMSEKDGEEGKDKEVTSKDFED